MDQREFLNTASKLNYLRMSVIAAFILVFELIVACFVEEFRSRTFYLAVVEALFQIVFIPLLYFMYKHIETISKLRILAVQTAFLIFMILGGILWSLFEQGELATSSTYMLAVFCAAAFIIMPPVISAVLFLSGFIVFLILIPQFQTNENLVQTLLINTFAMTVLAWVLNQMVFSGVVHSYQNEKTILEKSLELEKKNRELNEMTMKDSMTNLLNHKHSLIRLEEEVERANRINYPLSIAMIDLDNFKMINDSFGHQVGDEIIVQIAGILSENCRAADVIGRYGGEEFIVIMPDTNDSDAAVLIQRIQNCIKEAKFKNGITVTLSCGISELRGETVHGILKSSDIMLYEAKRKGKDRIEVHLDREKKSAEIN